MMKITLSKIALALGFIASASVLNVANAASLVGLTTGNQLAFFDSTNVAASSLVNIQGLSAGESLVGIDLRPTNNTIYGISSANKVYTIDTSGNAVSVSTLSSPIINTTNGYGFDFNPAADHNLATSLRLVSTAGDNYAVNVNSGVVANLAANAPGATPSNRIGTGYSAVAYTNSGPTPPNVVPTLYYINDQTNALAVNANAGAFNAPTINQVGNGFGFDILRANGFEIFSDGFAIAALTILEDDDLVTNLYNINLTSGTATFVEKFNGSLNGLTAAPSAVPVPAAAWLFGSALIGFAGFRRKSV